MKTPAFSLRFALLALLVTFPVFALAAQSSAERAEELLNRNGRIVVSNVGPYVEAGTYLIQVVVKLGPPTVKLSDRTWLYDDFQVDGSAAHGTLVVRFERGRVSELSLVTPAVALAMRNQPKPTQQLLAKAMESKK